MTVSCEQEPAHTLTVQSAGDDLRPRITLLCKVAASDVDAGGPGAAYSPTGSAERRSKFDVALAAPQSAHLELRKNGRARSYGSRIGCPIMWKPWSEIDWDAPRPSPADLMTSQTRIRFSPLPSTSAAADQLLQIFRSILDNGGAYLASFKVEDVDDAGHWFLSRNRFEEFEFANCLITSDGLPKPCPRLRAEGSTRRSSSPSPAR